MCNRFLPRRKISLFPQLFGLGEQFEEHLMLPASLPKHELISTLTEAGSLATLV